MKLRILAAVSFSLSLATLPAADAPALKTLKDKASYSIGVNVGANLKRQGIDVDPDVLILAIKDVLLGNKLALAEAEMQQTLVAYQRELEAKAKALGEKNKKEGEEFLAENKKKAGVTTTASGLQYKVIKAASGKKPTAQDAVRVHYKGTLIDGKEFDSSYKDNEPVEFALAGVIGGWTEALQLMPVGSKWQLFLPPALAYREDGSAPDIGPNATLIFEVELLAIVGQTKPDK